MDFFFWLTLTVLCFAKLRVPNLLSPYNFINHELAFVSNKRDVRRAVVNKHRPKE